MSTFNRRKFLGTAAAAAGSAAILSATGNSAFAQDRRIRHFWWGNPERDKRTFEVIRLFNEKNPGIVVAGETLGSADYFTRLTTQIAGRNMADAIQMGYGVMFEYINRGAILPLDDYIGKSLDISQIDESALSAGRVDGKLYALSIGANSHVSLYNTRLFDAAGTEVARGTAGSTSSTINPAVPRGTYYLGVSTRGNRRSMRSWARGASPGALKSPINSLSRSRKA